MKFKEFTKKQIFILLLVGVIGIIVLTWIMWFGMIDTTITFHITSDNNTLEIFRSINYTAIS